MPAIVYRLERRFVWVAAAIGLAAALIATPPSPLGAQSSAKTHWVGTWATAVVSSLEPPLQLRRTPTPEQTRPGSRTTPIEPVRALSNQTLRQIIHTSIGGSQVRIVFTNAFGTDPLAIGAAHVARRGQGSSLAAGSGRPLTFGGRPSVTVPVGAAVFSDPAELAVAPFSDLAVDLFVPGDTAGTALTQHTRATQTSYLSEPGNHAGKPEFPAARTISSWWFLARVEVLAPASVGALVAFGDSITDGLASTTDANARWPDQFARRLAAGRMPMGVLNLGISGNRLLANQVGTNALARFDREVAAQTGATHVIVLEGINDIGLAFDDASPTVEDLVVAHQQLIVRAHARGLRIYGATLTPFEGASYATSVGESKRRQFNTWIRTSGMYDAVIDFEAAVRDPQQPPRMLPLFDPGDHLHFTDGGYRTLAEAIDLNLFRSTR